MRLTITLCAFFVLCAACETQGTTAPIVALKGPQTFEEFAADIPFDEQTGTYVLEGDIALDREALRAYFAEQAGHNALIAYDAAPNRWPAGTKLTYCVSPDFGTARSAQVRQALREAGMEWQWVTGIAFEWNWLHDLSCNQTNLNVSFEVRPAPPGFAFTARAFFPSTERDLRVLYLRDDAFVSGTAVTLPGVMRHELGHILGFAHEHYRPESPVKMGNCVEKVKNPWSTLTRFDGESVMEYPWCVSPARTGDLLLTKLDRRGAGCHYYGLCEWEEMGRGRDVAIAADGKVYALGTRELSDGFEVLAWDAGRKSWSSLNVGAISIAISDGPLVRAAKNNEISMLTSWGWVKLPGAAVRVAQGPGAVTWVLGTNRIAGGYQIFKFNNDTWSFEAQRQGAETLAVDPSGWAWVTTDDKRILSSLGGTDSWRLVTPGASGIGIGANGKMWTLSATDYSWYGWFIDEWGDASFKRTRTQGAAAQIAVDPQGVPWIADTWNRLYRNRFEMWDAQGI